MTSVVSLDLDRDDLRSCSLDFTPSIPIVTSGSQGHSSDSSIQKAPPLSTSTFSSSYPTLAMPNPHYLYGPLRVHSQLEQLAEKQTKIFEKQIKEDIAEIERLDAEVAEKLRKAAEATKTQETWGTLSNVAQYLMSGSAIVIGVTLLPATPWAGGMLLASGALSISERILHDTGAAQAMTAWFIESEDLQKKIATRIEMGMMFLSLGFGLGGGAWAHGLGLLAAANRAADVQKVITGIGVGAAIGKGVGDLGNAFAKKRNSHLEADIQIIQTKREEIYQQLQQESKEVENLVGTVTDIGNELKQAISNSVVHPD